MQVWGIYFLYHGTYAYNEKVVKLSRAMRSGKEQVLLNAYQEIEEELITGIMTPAGISVLM